MVVFLLFDVLDTHRDDRSDVVVREGIKDVLAVPPARDQLRVSQDPELVRHRGLRHVQRVRQFCHGVFLREQGEQDPHPGRVSEHFEQFRQIHQFDLVRNSLFAHATLPFTSSNI